MSTLSTFMSTDHKACDDAFAIAEEAASSGNWNQATDAFNTFQSDMAQHFRMEEEVLFPSLISSGGPAGPVSVMLMEHAQMNELIEQMAASVASKDASEYGGLSETLLIVMQQHNLKEEQILYPIADRFLAGQADDLLTQLKAV
jgi:iron-sulfur cluster repair protein YtfE (RIC family)